MLLAEIDEYYRSLLATDEFSKCDYAMNGLQFGNRNADITKVAFAVDACAETFRRAAEAKAQLLFVHHGLFWGKVYPLTGRHHERFRLLSESGLALYAVHLPLDAHPVYGNNAGIADRLGLQNREPFAEYHGKKIGVKGRLASARSLNEIKSMLDMENRKALGQLGFGNDKITSIGIVSGGAAKESFQAIEENLDLYITGDTSHEIYHHCLEAGINVLFGGHYNTETYGVRSMCEKTAQDLGIETFFIDLPTGL
ncbi:MAG: Nif3-like dinuclear metal center hexameric protein [Spirochaetales bacterium]|nr:Nif3-like dinuclear metal center hexameric protein [Spirochaetales bacterium]